MRQPRRGAQRRRKTLRDWCEPRALHARFAATAAAMDRAGVLDWRDRIAVDAGDQMHCQSCSAFAVAAAIRLQGTIDENPVAIAPGYLHTCNGLPGVEDRDVLCDSPVDPGILLQRLVDTGWDPGAATDYPYPARACAVGRPRVQLKRIVAIGSPEAAKRALANGPLVAQMRLPRDFLRFRGEVYEAAAVRDAPLHTVCVIGYNQQGWIILNSAGPGWGDGRGCATVLYSLCGLIHFRRGLEPLGVYAIVM